MSALFLSLALLLLLPLALFGASAATNSGRPSRRSAAPVKPGVIPIVTSKVLVYDDDFQHSPTGPELALTAQGIPYTYVSDPVSFVASLTLQEWDLVIFANEAAGIDASTLDALHAYLAASQNHKAIVQTWMAGTFPAHPLWATLGIQSPQDFYGPTPLYWWSGYHPLFNQPNAVPNFDTFNDVGASVYGASFTLTGSAGPGLGGFTLAPAPGMAGIVLSPDNRTIYKGLLDFCSDQDANANGTWDVQEWWENAIRTLYPRPLRVMAIYADAYGVSTALSNLHLYPDVLFVDLFDAQLGTPTLDDLKAHDVVVVWSCWPFDDPAELGDRLADYVDAGGRVICAVYDFHSSPSFFIGGRFNSGGYSPLVNAGANLQADYSTLGTYTASHRAMWGVSNLAGFWRQRVAVAAGATLVASWTDGWPLLASKDRVVAINAYIGGDSMNPTTGDVTTLFHNAAVYLTSPKVLVARAWPTIDPLLAAVRKNGDIALLDEMDVRSTTPTLDQLLAYDVVFAFSDAPYADMVAMGNILADYVDAGGHVVLGAFDWYGPPYGLDGRIMNTLYNPFSMTSPIEMGSLNMGDYDATHPIMQGVSQCSGVYRDVVTVNPDAKAVASWVGGNGLVATLDNVTGINAFPGTATALSGDWTTLFHNVFSDLFYLNVSASASPTSGSAEMLVHFTGYAKGGVPPWTFAWDFGDGGSSATQNPDHTYAAEGTYTVRLVVTDSTGRTSDARRLSITVGPPLALAPTATPRQGQIPLLVAFAANASGGTPPYTYEWDYDDGTAHVAAQNPSHTYTEAGTYTPMLHVWDAQGHLVVWPGFPITAYAPLSASASAVPTSGSAPMEVSFTSTPSGGVPPYYYGWIFGDGTGTSLQNPTHPYSAQGTYTATLTVTDSASHSASATPITITVTAPLSASARAVPTSGSTPLTVAFGTTVSGGTAPYTYDWNFGDGTAHGNTQAPSHTYNAVGTFTATVTVTDSAPSPHTASGSTTITVKPPPPVITLMKKVAPPFTIVATGSNIQNGIQVYINGSLWSGVLWKTTGKVKITGGASLKAVVPKGVATSLRFVNPDTGESTTVWS